MKRQSVKQVGLCALWALLLLSCGAGGLIRNPDVERWCGDTPCDWQVEGEIRRVGTWHPNDYAVALISDDAALIQENGTVDNRDSDCFSFTMVAKIASGVKVFLELDFLADGSVEFSQQLPVSDWERRTFKVSAPEWYHKVRFIIRKEGPGRAILAEIAAENAHRQCSAPPIELDGRPDGALCSSSDQCASGAQCTNTRCGGCVNDSGCAEGQICGLHDVSDQRFKSCVDVASAPLGMACDRDDQCTSGVCSDGACSECASDADCDAGQQCFGAHGKPTNSRYWPRLCGVGQESRDANQACTSDLDCRSRDCEGFDVDCDLNLNCMAGNAACGTCGPDLQLGACR